VLIEVTVLSLAPPVIAQILLPFLLFLVPGSPLPPAAPRRRRAYPLQRRMAAPSLRPLPGLLVPPAGAPSGARPLGRPQNIW
jgi:hypothetical protein